MPERDELDRLIDSELPGTPSRATGLEQRVMVRIDTEAPARSRVFGARGGGRWPERRQPAAIILSIGVPLSMRQNGTTVSTAGGGGLPTVANPSAQT